MDDPTMERGDFLFKVKEHVDGSPFIVLEPFRENLPVFKNGILSFELTKGTTAEQAQELAHILRDTVKYVRYLHGE